MPDRPRLTPAIADVRRAVREALHATGLNAGDLVLVACSGGADSLALAAATAFEAPRADLRAGAVVVDHQMQAGSEQVASDVAERLRALGLEPVVVKTVEVGAVGGPEAAARDARYAALTEAAIEFGAVKVLLGHTLNDQAETVLLGLARGSGARSLNGMAADSGNYLRPLLAITRETTEAFCADSGLEVWHDPMNTDDTFSRVRVRRNLLPALEIELGPGVAEALARTAAQLREDDEVLTQLANEAFDRVAKAQATQINLEVAGFAQLPLAIRHRVVQRAAELLDAPMLARVHIRGIDDLVDSWHGQKPLTLPGIRVERMGDQIALKTTKTLKPGAC